MTEKTKRIGSPSATAALGEEPVPRLVLRFAATTMAALLLNAVYTLTDTLFVSWGVGENAMGGVSVVFPFVILQGAISTALGGGAASIISRKLGEGKKQEAGEVTLNAMLAFYSSAILITILGLALLNPLLEVMGVTGELLPYAKQYFTILLAGNVFSTGFSSIIRAEGKIAVWPAHLGNSYFDQHRSGRGIHPCAGLGCARLCAGNGDLPVCQL